MDPKKLSETSRLPTEAGTFPPLRGPSAAETMGGPPESTLDYRNHHTIAALFPNRESAERAIAELRESSRYAPAEVGVAMRDRTSQGQLVEETGTHAIEGASIGVVSGGLLGGLAGWLIAAGIVAIPGVGPVLAGGALASSLGLTAGTAAAGAGLGAAAGGLAGALVGFGLPEHEVAFFEKGFRDGGVIVTVRSKDVSEAAEILQRHSGTLRSSDSVASSNLINT